MKLLIKPWIILFMLIGINTLCWSELIIVDHTSTNIHEISESAILQTKADLYIAYGHTSHGSQLITGMNGLVYFMNDLGYPNNLYDWSESGSSGTLHLDDRAFSGASDLGNPDRTSWANATENYLNANPECNVVIWSWCGQVSSATEANINTYLALMNQLEIDYPNVQFVYMTGHLDGSGETGNLNIRNNQIRNYCITNEKILYDFADIESYDPDGQVNYMPLLCNDNCDYDSDNNNSRDSNWATDWQNSHTQNVDWFSCSAAHSQALNGNLKAYAAWYLWARLAGWSTSGLNAPSNLHATANSSQGIITLSWQDNNGTIEEDSFIIQRSLNGTTWNNSYASVGQNVTTFIDSSLTPGTYEYRIIAHADDNGQGQSVDSPPSNIVSAQIIEPIPPFAPSQLTITADSLQQTIELSWTDNSDNENSFIVQRQFNSEGWNNDYALVDSNSTDYIDINLIPGTYSYRIISRNEFGDSSSSNIDTAEILELPNTPGDLTAIADNTNGIVNLNWSDNSTSETGFVIQRQVDANAWNNEYAFVSANVTIFTDNNNDNPPMSSGNYRYRVCAFNANGNSNPSNESLTQVVTDTPLAPSNLIASIDSGNIILTWIDNSNNEESFQIDCEIDDNGYELVADLPANTDTWTHTGLSADHTYSYQVKATNNLGDSNYSNESSIFLPEQTFTITLQDTTQVEDAFLQSANSSTNYGNTNYLSSFDGYVCKFNFPSEVLNKKIISARIAFYVWNQTNFEENQYMHLYEVTSAWLENTVTYNTTPDYDTEPIGSILHLEGSGNWDHVFYPAVDVTNLVQCWVDALCENNGILLSNEQSVTGIGLKASEYSNNSRTYLEITYTNQTNTEPVILPVSNSNVFEGEQVEFNVNITDEDLNDTITLSIEGRPQGSILTQTAERTWQFIWQTDFNSNDNSPYIITFTANDGTDDSIPLDVQITIHNVSTDISLNNKPDWFQEED